MVVRPRLEARVHLGRKQTPELRETRANAGYRTESHVHREP
jgi:hypothetical protein